jgi:LPXTG-motif cell wall-anchored protein
VPRPRRLLTFTCALVLALPGTALAGGAGDDQYQDPFGDEAPAETPQESAPQESEPQQAEPAPAPAAESGSAGADAQAAAPSAAASAQTLPRTGGDPGIAAIGGGVLLLAGLVLRRRTADDAGR